MLFKTTLLSLLATASSATTIPRDSSSYTDINKCLPGQISIKGTCFKAGAFCGGFAAIPCADAKQICVDDPRDDCDPKKGGADCGGVCIEPLVCGGFLGTLCPKGLTCVDDPRDDCDPENGGADCGGICVA
ncbi:hypothetical protein GE21DRAFT_6997 [Neurospora crassa]|uniref:Uncharacterized protein n=2 Tax=Neurospora crassa TaxID=5141 RepID=Q1K6J9_NEUCR|nr:hypothetical protein NCU09691 [Neurospora crassa OR74A]EAA31402.1 hypothetical protein NCU09691 [Neurospora crassa OR74A]KHE80109.1 hypothetical protein GE21DRAFT_6997 [Neurospora crassa]CAD70722.1 putative protein [Neurospora crassa]|eukprot:XP_960638.1 hypothetical protein NCU09691 [Neurospora crassa OR74A]